MIPHFDIQQINLIIGLGNPGTKYAKTRHNAGFLFLDHLYDKYSTTSWKEESGYAWVTIELPGVNHLVTLLKPMTGMNISGQHLAPWTKKGVKPDQMLVAHDELEKSFGSVAVKIGGSAKGHNGLRSIIERIGFDFWRLRLGIGRPENKEDVPNYVLERYSPSEMQELKVQFESAFRMLGL